MVPVVTIRHNIYFILCITYKLFKTHEYLLQPCYFHIHISVIWESLITITSCCNEKCLSSSFPVNFSHTSSVTINLKKRLSLFSYIFRFNFKNIIFNSHHYLRSCNECLASKFHGIFQCYKLEK